jgi:hypothetical protein
MDSDKDQDQPTSLAPISNIRIFESFLAIESSTAPVTWFLLFSFLLLMNPNVFQDQGNLYLQATGITHRFSSLFENCHNRLFSSMPYYLLLVVEEK